MYIQAGVRAHHRLNESVPEESNLRQQSENPYSTAKCKGNIPWIPRLARQNLLHWLFKRKGRLTRKRVACLAEIKGAYLAVSAPLVISVLISSSWPYLAAMWRGVLPYLSTQSISPPDGSQRGLNDSCAVRAPTQTRRNL